MENFKKVTFITELYAPESNSTGYFLTGIAEGVSLSSRVINVITCDPVYHFQKAEKTELPVFEMRNGVCVYRVWTPKKDPKKIFGRLLNFFSFSVFSFLKGLRLLRANGLIIAVTNPPSLPFIALILSVFKGSKFILLVHDVYPEVFCSVGILKHQGLVYKALNWISSLPLNAAKKVVVLGRDMERLVAKKLKDPSKIVIIPNWGALENLEEISVVTEGRVFTVLYCGNHGRTHDLVSILYAAEALSKEKVQFRFVGDGSGKAEAINCAKNLDLKNVSFEERVSSQNLGATLQSANLCVVSFKPGMEGVSVPSRMYNLMLSGRPLLALCSRDSELAMVIEEEDCGWVVEDPSEIAETILIARNDPEGSMRKGENGRKAALEKYSKEVVVAQWQKLIAEFG